MRHGVHPVERRETNYSTRTFGALAASYVPFSLDAGFGFPDQNADGFPQACTAYTQNELCQDEDQTLYDRSFLWAKILLIAGQADGPVSIYDALKAPCVYGVRPSNETTDAQALARKRGAYFQLERARGLDWFDSAIALMQTTKRPLSIASPWFPSFEAPMFGEMPEIFPATWELGVPGHNHAAYGLTLIDGQPAIVGKSWQGAGFGDHGKHYWTRKAFNALLDIPGSGAFTLAPWDGSIQTIQTGLIYRLQVLISLYLRQLRYAMAR